MSLTKFDAAQVLRAVFDENSQSLKMVIGAAEVVLDNDQPLNARNAADNGDVALIKADASDNVQVGDAANLNDINLMQNTNVSGDLDVTGAITCATVAPANGFSGSFLAQNGDTVTVVNGIITSVAP